LIKGYMYLSPVGRMAVAFAGLARIAEAKEAKRTTQTHFATKGIRGIPLIDESFGLAHRRALLVSAGATFENIPPRTRQAGPSSPSAFPHTSSLFKKSDIVFRKIIFSYS
jgi:hypothetical protein